MVLLGGSLASTSQAQTQMETSSVWPVLVDLRSDARATITLRNDRARAVFYQVSVLRWGQENGKDRYDRSTDLIASPPQFSLAAGSSQIIRLGFRQPTPSPTERAYRVMVAEVPPDNDRSSDGGHIQFAMQYAIPVFVAGSIPTAASPLTWQLQQEGNIVRVRADNPSNQRVALNAVGLIPSSSPSTQPQHSKDQRVTVLAHAWREWRIPLSQASTPSAAASDWRIVVQASDSSTWQAIAANDMRAQLAPH
jgi:fimbrial chaperone protein